MCLVTHAGWRNKDKLFKMSLCDVDPYTLEYMYLALRVELDGRSVFLKMRIVLIDSSMEESGGSTYNWRNRKNTVDVSTIHHTSSMHEVEKKPIYAYSSMQAC